MGKKCFGKSRSEPERIFPHKPKVPLQDFLFCQIKRQLLLLLSDNTPRDCDRGTNIHDVESKLSTIGDNLVEQKLDNFCDGDESDFGNLLGRTLDSIVRMIVKMMMVMARSQMFN